VAFKISCVPLYMEGFLEKWWGDLNSSFSFSLLPFWVIPEQGFTDK
jgi:hypothetical protein